MRVLPLPTSVLGRTGLTVTKLGYGAMELRGPDDGRAQDVPPAEADELLNANESRTPRQAMPRSPVLR